MCAWMCVCAYMHAYQVVAGNESDADGTHLHPLSSVHTSICLGRWLSFMQTRFPSKRNLRWSSIEDMCCMLGRLWIEVLRTDPTLKPWGWYIHRQRIMKPCKRSTWVTTAHSRPYRKVAMMTETMILSLVCAFIFLWYHNTGFRDWKTCDALVMRWVIPLSAVQSSDSVLPRYWKVSTASMGASSSSQTAKNPRLFLSVALLSVVTETSVAA